MKLRCLSKNRLLCVAVCLLLTGVTAAANGLSNVSRPADFEPGSAARLVIALRSETDPARVAALAQQILEQRVAVRDRETLRDALELLGGDPLAERRVGALALLSYAADVEPELVTAVAATSRADSDQQVRSVAVLTLAAWMHERPVLTAQISRELLEVVRTSPADHEAHVLALQSVALLDRVLPKDVLQGMANALRTEPAADRRAIAALALGAATGDASAFAVRELELAYERETDLDTKRNLITQIVRTARGEAVPILQRLASTDPLIDQDIRDYVEILATGATDPDDVFGKKSRRDAARGTFVGADHHHD